MLFDPYKSWISFIHILSSQALLYSQHRNINHLSVACHTLVLHPERHRPTGVVVLLRETIDSKNMFFLSLLLGSWISHFRQRKIFHLNQHWLSDWVTDWLTRWLTGWLTDWLAGWLASWLTDWLADWLTDWLTRSLKIWVSKDELDLPEL